MSARAEVPHPQRHSAGAQLLLRFLENLPPYRWTRARLVRWGVTGRTAVIAVPYLWLLFVFLILGRQIIGGIMKGAVKG